MLVFKLKQLKLTDVVVVVVVIVKNCKTMDRLFVEAEDTGAFDCHR
jgi:hypothetical protein